MGPLLDQLPPMQRDIRAFGMRPVTLRRRGPLESTGQCPTHRARTTAAGIRAEVASEAALLLSPSKLRGNHSDRLGSIACFGHGCMRARMGPCNALARNRLRRAARGLIHAHAGAAPRPSFLFTELQCSGLAGPADALGALA